MSDFVKALESKIKVLHEKRVEYQEAIETIEHKLELLGELYAEEMGGLVPIHPEPSKVPTKKRGGRPKGAKNKRKPKGTPAHAVADELYQQAMQELSTREGGGTSADLQERRIRSFNPSPRPAHALGPGITAGTKKQVEQAQTNRKVHATVSIDEDE